MNLHGKLEDQMRIVTVRNQKGDASLCDLELAA
jgi:hypothetical protein